MRWIPVLVVGCGLAACGTSSLHCDAGTDRVDRFNFTAGLVGEPVALTLTERFCRQVVPGALPSLTLSRPGDDAPGPMYVDGLELDEVHSSVTVHFTPDRPGSYFLKGVLAGRVAVVQELLPVAVDRRDAGRVPRAVPEECLRTISARPFGAAGVVCTNSPPGQQFLGVGSTVQRVLGESDVLVTDGEAAWVLDVGAQELQRFVEAGDGGLERRGVLPVPLMPSVGGSLTPVSPGRVLSSFGGVQVIAAAADGGLFVERRLGPAKAYACLRGETLVQMGFDGALEVGALDGGARTPIEAGLGPLGCSGESVWLSNWRTPVVFATLPPEGADAGLALRRGTLERGLQLYQAAGVPFAFPLLHPLSTTGEVYGPLVPAVRGDHVEFEYYGRGEGLSAGERTLLLHDERGTWLVTRP